MAPRRGSRWRPKGTGQRRHGVSARCGVTLCLLLWLGSLAAAADDQRAAVYRRPIGHDPQTLDPARVSDTYGRSVAQQLFDGLVQFDSTLMVTPALAEFWKATRDGMTWTFTLRKGVRFHDGSELTARDVVYSLTRVLDPATRSGGADLFLHVAGAADFRAGRAKTVSGLRVLDRSTVQVVLTDAAVPLVSLLAVGQAKIVPEAVAARGGDQFGSRPVGTGPFKFVRWERGKEIVLEANEAYFGGAPRLSRLVFRIFPGHHWDDAFAEFQRGQLEDTVPPSRAYGEIVQDPRWTYLKRSMISIRFYGFNTKVKPLDDRRVRLALVHALDRRHLIEQIHGGRDTVARGILPPGSLGYNPGVRTHAYDPERARQLLAEAGYPGGRGLPPIVVTSSVNAEPFLREHEFVRRALSAVGVKVEFAYVTDWPAFSAALAQNRLQAFMYAWYADVPDPDNFLSKLFDSRSPRNLFAYANPGVDALLSRARAEIDVQRRVDAYRRAEEQILDDAPLIPILHHSYERLFQPSVRGIEVSGLGDPYLQLRKMWLERR